MKVADRLHQPVARIWLTTPSQASVLQIKDAIQRATATHLQADGRDEQEFLAGVEVTDSTWGEWADTAFDVKLLHL